jgi:hypothetical protein
VLLNYFLRNSLVYHVLFKVNTGKRQKFNFSSLPECHAMKVSGYLHAPVILLSEKDPTAPVDGTTEKAVQN